MTKKDVKQELGIGNRITRVVVFKNAAAASESDAAKTRKQAALDILNKENAWPELRITRNETLFGDVACVEGGSPEPSRVSCITLPIIMAPPFDFTIPDGKDAAGKPFPQSLAEAIKAWLDERHPSGKNGRFVFDISVYSSIGESKLPIYRLRNLRLGVKKDATTKPNSL